MHGLWVGVLLAAPVPLGPPMMRKAGLGHAALAAGADGPPRAGPPPGAPGAAAVTAAGGASAAEAARRPRAPTAPRSYGIPLAGPQTMRKDGPGRVAVGVGADGRQSWVYPGASGEAAADGGLGSREAGAEATGANGRWHVVENELIADSARSREQVFADSAHSREKWSWDKLKEVGKEMGKKVWRAAKGVIKTAAKHVGPLVTAVATTVTTGNPGALVSAFKTAITDVKDVALAEAREVVAEGKKHAEEIKESAAKSVRSELADLAKQKDDLEEKLKKNKITVEQALTSMEVAGMQKVVQGVEDMKDVAIQKAQQGTEVAERSLQTIGSLAKSDEKAIQDGSKELAEKEKKEAGDAEAQSGKEG